MTKVTQQYAWLVGVSPTDRAPNTDFCQITSSSEAVPNLFYDPEPAPVGGAVMPANKLEILAPYLALTALAGAVTATVALRRKRD